MKVDGLREAVKGAKAMRNRMQEAASKALNRVGQGVMTEASRKLRETYNVKAQDVKASMRIVLSAADAGEVIIKAKGPNLPLRHFKLTPKQGNPAKPKPVKVAVKRGETKKIDSAFVHAGSGKVRVLKRKKPSGHSGRKRVRNAKKDYPELPITELHGPAIPVMLNEPQVIKHIEEQAEDRMLKRLEHEVGRILK